jgi:MFS transporter, DHA2 family, multidrug resistance protein
VAGRWWTLAALVLAVLAVSLDATVLSVALPTLSRALQASETDLQWFQSAYLLALAGAMMPAGFLGDRYGRRTMTLIWLALFACGSAWCAYSSSPASFIAARVLLGAAGAGVVVTAVSVIAVIFPEQERPKAVGIWSAATFLALPAGPILGGWLLSDYWWGWVFLINVPVAVTGLIAVGMIVPESRAARRPALDLPAVAGSIAGFAAVTYGLIEAGRDGWGSGLAWALIAAGLALLGLLGRWEAVLGRRSPGAPMIDMALFRSASFTWGVILAAVAVLAMMGVLFVMPQYFQGVAGADAMGSGLRLLPLAGGLVAGALPASAIARSAGSKLAVAGGFVILTAGLALGALMRPGSGEGFIAAWTAVSGLGMGVALATSYSAALSRLPAERAGAGTGVLQALNKMGAPLGTAILGSVLSSAYLGRLDLARLPVHARAAAGDGIFGGVAAARELGSPALLHAVRAAFVHGTDVALVVSAAIATLGLILALALLPGTRPSAPRTGNPAAGDSRLPAGAVRSANAHEEAA